MENFVVDDEPEFVFTCNSVSLPKAANPALAITILPGLFPTLTRDVPPPVAGAGKNEVEAVEDVNVPVSVPKSYVHTCPHPATETKSRSAASKDL